jgi:ABC-type transporter Mla subunit MlaD
MTCDIANAVDDIRQLIAKADALAHAAEDLFDETIEIDDVDDRRRLERIAHLIGATATAVEAALEAGEELAHDLATRRGG